MNTIPTTSKRVRIPYTVVGGEKFDKKQRPRGPVSMVILNRSGRLYKADVAAQLDKCGIHEIISVEGPAVSYDIENLSLKYPRIRFVLLHEEASPGEKINIAVEEAHSSLVLVIWDDIKIPQPVISSKLVQKIHESDILCTVPLLQDGKRETVPSIAAPAFYRKKLKCLHLLPQTEGMDTIFPFDYIGLYKKDLFTQSGGYDGTITEPHWQKLDFGFRSRMWGEKIRCAASFQLQYIGEIPSEDENISEGYRHFFLKNLAIRFNGDTGSLPRAKFLSYWLKSGAGFINSLEEFRKVREWVEINKYRFKEDARSVTELWVVDEK